MAGVMGFWISDFGLRIRELEVVARDLRLVEWWSEERGIIDVFEIKDRFFTAKPLPHKARGCDEGATPGKKKSKHNLEEVVSLLDFNPRQSLRGCVFFILLPKAAFASPRQPWAV
jgi:hypothetical protein